MHTYKRPGFTLIELMVVVAIVAIIAAVAVPSYLSQVRKSRRSDAARAISELQLRQERWRANHAEYVGSNSPAADLTEFGALPTSDYYAITLDSTKSATGYTLKATPTGDQLSDTSCNPMRLQVSGYTVTKTPASGCWK